MAQSLVLGTYNLHVPQTSSWMEAWKERIRCSLSAFTKKRPVPLDIIKCSSHWPPRLPNINKKVLQGNKRTSKLWIHMSRSHQFLFRICVLHLSVSGVLAHTTLWCGVFVQRCQVVQEREAQLTDVETSLRMNSKTEYCTSRFTLKICCMHKGRIQRKPITMQVFLGMAGWYFVQCEEWPEQDC